MGMLNELRLYDINIREEDDGEETAERLADAISSNSSITILGLRFTDLLWRKNMERWGIALMENKTIKVLELRGMEDDVVKTLQEATKGREPELDIINSCKEYNLHTFQQIYNANKDEEDDNRDKRWHSLQHSDLVIEQGSRNQGTNYSRFASM